MYNLNIHPIVHTNVNNTLNSGGGSITMKKKYANKFNNISKGQFSLNGIDNNDINRYIGNRNYGNVNSECKTFDNNIKTSVKNNKAYIANKLLCSPVKSLSCYQNVNFQLVTEFKKDGIGLNKFFNSDNKTQSNYIYLLQSSVGCNINKEHLNDISNNGTNCCLTNNINSNIGSTSNFRTMQLIKSNNITKDITQLLPNNYDIYYNNGKLFQSVSCLKNPPDAKVIGCRSIVC